MIPWNCKIVSLFCEIIKDAFQFYGRILNLNNTAQQGVNVTVKERLKGVKGET